MSDSVPILYSTIISATNHVKNPNKKESEKHKLNTLYKAYKNHRESEFFHDPQIGMSFMNSPFFQTAGIPVVQIYYDCDKEEQILCNPSIDPIFNSMDENFEVSPMSS